MHSVMYHSLHTYTGLILPAVHTSASFLLSDPITLQVEVHPNPVLTEATTLTFGWGLLSHAQNAVRWLVYILVWLFNLPLATAQLGFYVANIG